MPDPQSSDAQTGTATTGNITVAPDTGTIPAAPATDPLATKLDGEAVPEKFRGKAVADVIKSYAEAEQAMLRAQTEAAQWRNFAEGQVAKPAAPVTPTYNPMDDLDERSAKAVNHLIQASIKETVNNVLGPIAEGVAGMQLEFVKATRPDFPEVETRARDYFNSMPLQARLNPAYGWDFAYRLATAEKMGKPALIPRTPTPPVPGASTGAAPGATGPSFDKDQLRYMELTGMTPETYTKYGQPVDIVGEQLKKMGRR